MAGYLLVRHFHFRHFQCPRIYKCIIINQYITNNHMVKVYIGKSNPNLSLYRVGCAKQLVTVSIEL